VVERNLAKVDVEGSTPFIRFPINTFMRYRDLFEKYSSSNSYLRNYLATSDDFDPYHYWGAIALWAEKNEDGREAFAEILGKDHIGADDIQEEEPDIFYKLPEHLQHEAAQWATDYIMRHDPAEAASTQFFSLRDKRLVPRQTWLVHFTDDPDAIAEQGFAMGTHDMARLGLTTHYKKSAKTFGGYNFAFIADSKYANWAASERKYGKHAVMFQNSGVHTWHYSDEEDQIIFWGADVKPRDIVVLMHRDDWQVRSNDQRNGYTDRSLFVGDFEKCVDWVIANFQQYRRALTR
jgi:hypothetical protein